MFGGLSGTWTHDFYLARVALSQLSYKPKKLCLSMTQIEKLEAGVGFEPTTLRLWALVANHCITLRYYGAGDRNRTYNLLITSQLLYRWATPARKGGVWLKHLIVCVRLQIKLVNGGISGTRTPDLLINSQLLWPTELISRMDGQ